MLALAALILVPLASAAPMEARFDALPPIRIQGQGEIMATGALLDLSTADDIPALSWGSAEGYEVHRERKNTNVVGIGTADEPTVDNRTLAYGAGTLTDLRCSGICEALLFPVDDAGAIRAAGALAGEVAALDAPREHSPYYYVSTEMPSWTLPPGTLLARAPLSEVAITGRVGLLLWNVTGTLETGGASEPLVTGTTMRPGTGPTGAFETIVRTRYVMLTLEDAVLHASDATAELLAPSFTIALDGGLAARDAHGFVRLGPERHELRGDDLTVDGVTRATLGAEAREILGLAGPIDGPVAVQQTGDARSVVIEGARLEAPPTMTFATPTTIAVGGALVLAAAFLVALYSRITRASVFENANRRRIFETVQGRPGISATEISRAVGLARVVVQHHLRVLDRQRMVVERTVGGATLLFPPADVPRSEDLAIRAVVRNATRRAVATKLANAPLALTQREIAADLAISQRLVSYHLQELERAGLLVVDGSTLPMRYTASATLRANGEKLAA